MATVTRRPRAPGARAGATRGPDPADAHRAARIFATLAHPARIELICALARRRAASQKDLLAEFAWPQSTMAHHLGALRDRGLLRATRQGNQILLSLDGTVTPQLLAVVCEWVHPDTHEQFIAGFTRGTEALR